MDGWMDLILLEDDLVRQLFMDSISSTLWIGHYLWRR